MLNEKFLLDGFQATGSDIEEFEKMTEAIAEKTSFFKCNPIELSVLSFKEREEESNRLLFYNLNPLKVPSVSGSCKICESIIGTDEGMILSKGDFEPLIKELTDEVGILLYNGIKCMFVSNKVLTTRLQPFGLGGDFLSEKCVERDLIIAKRFHSEAKEKTLVAREYNGIMKIFSILSGRYAHVPQNILMQIYKEVASGDLGKAECRYWEINHFLSGIRIEFPEKAEEFKTLYGLKDEFVPGIFLLTSDTGDCSIKIRSTWRFKNSISLHREISQKHFGNFTIPELIKEVEEEIFSEYTKLPEALCDLMAQDITEPTWDLSTKTGLTKNSNKIEKVLRNAFKQLNIVGAVGKKTEMELFSQLHYEFDASISYTAYDFATTIMSMPERATGLSVSAKEKLEMAVGKAPYIKYEPKKTASAVTLIA